MKTVKLVFALIFFSKVLFAQNQSFRTLSKSDYLDKVYGGWIGKISGLTLGVPREYGESWPPGEINYFGQVPDHFSDLYSGDDLYYPLLVQTCLIKYGLHPSFKQIMKEYDKQLYSGRIWGATSQALDLYRAGIIPPKTGYPGYNDNWSALDALIAFDPMGWICPGMINNSAEYSDYWAHIVSWGEGADGCVFINAIYSEAFFTNDIKILINKAVEVLPAKSRFREMVADLLKWHDENNDWKDTRMIFAKKYSPELKYNDGSALVNTGAVLIGLLYGEKDFGKTVVIAMHCRWDSDCNAATSGGIIGTLLGFSNIDPKWSLIFHDQYENYCLKGLPRWMSIKGIAENTVALGEKVILENGGKISSNEYSIPHKIINRLTRTENFSKEFEEKNKAYKVAYIKDKFKDLTKTWNPIWHIDSANFEKKVEILPEYMGRKNVLKGRELVLEGEITLGKDKFCYLKIGTSNHPSMLCEATGQIEFERGWNLALKVNDEQVYSNEIRTQGDLVIWMDPQYDLTKWAGKTVNIKLVCQSTGPSSWLEFNSEIHSAYISDISLIELDKKESWR